MEHDHHDPPAPLVPDDAEQEPVDVVAECAVGVVDIVVVGLQGLEEVVQIVADAADVVGVADDLVLGTVRQLFKLVNSSKSLILISRPGSDLLLLLELHVRVTLIMLWRNTRSYPLTQSSLIY